MTKITWNWVNNCQVLKWRERISKLCFFREFQEKQRLKHKNENKHFLTTSKEPKWGHTGEARLGLRSWGHTCWPQFYYFWPQSSPPTGKKTSDLSFLLNWAQGKKVEKTFSQHSSPLGSFRDFLVQCSSNRHKVLFWLTIEEIIQNVAL